MNMHKLVEVGTYGVRVNKLIRIVEGEEEVFRGNGIVFPPRNNSWNRGRKLAVFRELGNTEAQQARAGTGSRPVAEGP